MKINGNDIITVQMVLEVCKKHRITPPDIINQKKNELSDYLKNRDPLNHYGKDTIDKNEGNNPDML